MGTYTGVEEERGVEGELATVLAASRDVLVSEDVEEEKKERTSLIPWHQTMSASVRCTCRLISSILHYHGCSEREAATHLYSPPPSSAPKLDTQPTRPPFFPCAPAHPCTRIPS